MVTVRFCWFGNNSKTPVWHASPRRDFTIRRIVPHWRNPAYIDALTFEVDSRNVQHEYTFSCPVDFYRIMWRQFAAEIRHIPMNVGWYLKEHTLVAALAIAS